MNKHSIKEVFQRFEVKAVVGLACLSPLSVVAFASTPPDSFDLAALMETTAQSIVTDLMKMIAGVLPIVATLLGASIGIAFGIKFIKKVTGKAG